MHYVQSGDSFGMVTLWTTSAQKKGRTEAYPQLFDADSDQVPGKVRLASVA